MPAFADDDGIVHGDAERACDVEDCLGHLDIGLRRRRIAAGVVMDEPTELTILLNRRCFLHSVQLQGSLIGDCKL